MKRCIIILLFSVVTCSWTASVPAQQNPFTSKAETRHKAPIPVFKSQFFVKIVVWQHRIKQKMSELIRDVHTRKKTKPLLVLVVLAFSYGLVHAAGPGHGKFVAMSYVLSHRASVMGGVLFGVFTAFLHGFSGAAGVLGLRYILQRGVGETLGSVTTATQIISFGLITLLGLGIFLKNGYALFSKLVSNPHPHPQEPKAFSKGLVPWALAVGLVPCPAVVMVMLFCLSMDALALGLVLAAFISFGMAVTISSVVIAVLAGKTGALQTVSKKRVEMFEHGIGLVSGMAVSGFGALFFIAAIGW